MFSFIKNERFVEHLKVYLEINQTFPNLQVPLLSIQLLMEDAVRQREGSLNEDTAEQYQLAYQ